ncbi:hypothetical protein TPHA_0L01880 [Tetrapisispora phaffii CBS 4417]|uniref:RNA recognition motif domain-containing protein n=1 Tax=Tetrapisispora phaffii (strain ATCC 24235 / CBS 4417 / NBRC 1672 / NRRL Y-8282 / UCD 70-5) TaxID=1071381 RepID=G8C063_TETPH|nr:hypothetical protein TPHA_0L01880 [Tetrapisispora phaffii CBS 4417]CCE65541.1 hypothetical protein TPHA_0L01880 [Tetrapisispora phaffii CBS 4417]
MSNNGNSLEDLRSKIIASMGHAGEGSDEQKNILELNRRQKYNGTQAQSMNVRKPSRFGPGSGKNGVDDPRRGTGPNAYNRRDGNNNRQAEYSNSNHGYDNDGRNTRYQRYQNNYSNQRYRSGERYQQNNDRNPHARDYQRNPRTVGPDLQLQDVISIDKRERMKPSRWDKTPKGFEKVAAERAKLSGLFPQPGQPQIVDKRKLASVVYHRGRKSRRTRILFEDDAVENIKFSKTNSQVVITLKDERLNIASIVVEIRKIVGDIINSFDYDYDLKDVRHNSDNIVLEFDCMEISTVILGCQNYINRKLNVPTPDIEWSRPGCFVLQTGHTSELCDREIICIQDFDITESEGELSDDKIRKQLEDLGVKNISHLKPVYRKSRDTAEVRNDSLLASGKQVTETSTTTNDSSTMPPPPPPPVIADLTEFRTSEKEFTNCVVLKLDNTKNDNSDDSSSKAFSILQEKFTLCKPNYTDRVQNPEDLTFQSLPKIVGQHNNVFESRVLLLLNCVDPLDLKNVAFIDEIKDTFYERFNKQEEKDPIQDMKIIQPNANYLLNFSHLHENVGNIYILFSNIAQARQAMQQLQGSKFNDRTILCSFFHETDYHNLEIL